MKNKKRKLNVKIILMIIISVLLVAILGGFAINYGAVTTQSIGTNVSATFNSSTGSLTIRSTSGTGTIDKDMFDEFKENCDTYEITSVTIENAVYAPADSSGLFKEFSYCTSITGLSNLNTANATDMSEMFAYCEELTNIDLSGFNTLNVTNMSYMFQDCSGITSLNVSSLNTSNVTDMTGMFEYCESLTNLNLSSFNTSSVTKMTSMFNECKELTSVNLTGFNTSNVTNLRSMFENCKEITTIDLSMFNTTKVTDMACMFMGCESLTTVNVTSFDTTRVTYLDSMFRGCSSLTYLDLRSFDMSNVYKREFFNGCTSLMELYTPSKTSSDVDLPGTFYDIDWTGEELHTCTNFVFPYEANRSYHLGRIFVITFYPNNGSNSGKEQLKKYNESVELDANTFVYPSHRFTNWSTRADGSGDTYLDRATYSIDKDLTLYAQWEAGVYTITLDNQNPTIEGTTSIDATIGYAMPSITLPQKTGYTFSGYFINLGGTGTKYYNANGSSAKNWDIDEDTTLHAYWVENTYTIAFNSNSGNGTMNSITGVRYTESKVLPANTFTKHGYTFKNWVDQNLTRYNDGQIVSYLTDVNNATVTLYAEWEKDTYTITYDLNGGELAYANPETYQVDSNTINLNNPTREGYTFAGWTGSNGSTPQTNVSIPTDSTGNRNYVANWIPHEYTIIYNLDGGSLEAGKTNPTIGKVDQDVVIENEPSRIGYVFTGWATTTTLGLGPRAKTGDSPNPTVSWSGSPTRNKYYRNLRGTSGQITIYAIWTPNTYTIEYNLNGGTLAQGETNPTTGTYDKTVYVEHQPVKDGYRFAGWSSNEENGLGTHAKTGIETHEVTTQWNGYTVNNEFFKNLRDVEGTVTLTANWAPITYTIVYDLNGGALENGKTNPTSSLFDVDVNIENHPTKLGYIFKGWTSGRRDGLGATATTGTGANPSTEWEGNITKNKYFRNLRNIEGTVTLTANWDPIEYTIVYTLNGGSLQYGKTNPTSGKYDQEVNIENHPIRDGYIFTGWTTSEDDGLQMHASTWAEQNSTSVNWYGGLTKNKYYINLRETAGTVTLSANWTPITYTISYILNGGTNNSSNPGTYQASSPTINIQEPERLGYVFTGWTGSNGTTPQKNVKILSGSTGDKEFEAHWSPIVYTIAYNLAGGELISGATNPTTGTFDQDVNIENHPIRDGYKFTGWTTSENYGLELHATTGTTSNPSTEWEGSLTKNKYFKNLRDNEGTVILTANWTPITYTIAYNLNGGALEAGKTNPTSSLFDVDVNIENHPTMFGYKFTGWTTNEADGLGIRAKTGITSNPTAGWDGTSTKNKYFRNLRDNEGTVLLTANWTPIEYTIVYSLKGGTLEAGKTNPATGVYDQDVNIENHPIKDGYIFTGWTTSLDDGLETHAKTGITSNPNTNWSGDLIKNKYFKNLRDTEGMIILTANWTPVTYSISYILNDGINSPLNPSTYQVSTPTIYLEQPTKIGYIFTGWTGSNGSVQQIDVSIPTGSTGNKEYEAHWSPIEYTIIYDLTGGELEEGRSNPTTGIYDIDVKISNYPVKEGHMFTGWTTSTNDGLEETAKTGISLNPTTNWGGSLTNNNYYKNLRCTPGTVKLTANWSENTYNIAFNSNGGIGYMYTMTGIRYTEQRALTSNSFTRVGYIFKGWSLTPDGEKVYNDGQIVTKLTNINGAVINLYAVWEKETYTITYVLNGGINDPSNPSTYQADTPTITIKQPTKEGYTFTGWTGSNGNTPQTNVSIPTGSTGNKAYVANWNANEYRILYNLNGGTLASGKTNPSTAKVDENVNIANYPTKPGYIFTGWTTSSSQGLESNAKTSATANPTTSWDGSLTTNKYYKNLRTNPGTVTLTANYVPDTNVKYTIKYFLQNLDTEIESYNEQTSLREEKRGTTGSMVQVEGLDIKDIEGFTYDETNPRNKLSGIVAADGSLVLEVYYKRNIYTIRYEPNGGTMASTTSKYYYGKRFVLSKNVRNGSNVFLGWYDNSDLQGNPVTYIEAGETGDRTFYAKWGDKNTLYVVSKDGKCVVEESMISYITPNTKLSNLPNKIDTNGNIVVKNKNGQQIGNNDLIGTGYTIIVSLNGQTKTFKASVAGDIDGNGKISMVDIVKANQGVLGKLSLSNEQKKAADLSGDNRLTLLDIVKMNQAYLGKISL